MQERRGKDQESGDNRAQLPPHLRRLLERAERAGVPEFLERQLAGQKCDSESAPTDSNLSEAAMSDIERAVFLAKNGPQIAGGTAMIDAKLLEAFGFPNVETGNGRLYQRIEAGEKFSVKELESFGIQSDKAVRLAEALKSSDTRKLGFE